MARRYYGSTFGDLHLRVTHLFLEDTPIEAVSLCLRDYGVFTKLRESYGNTVQLYRNEARILPYRLPNE